MTANTEKTVEKAVEPAKAVKATATSKAIKKEPALATNPLTRRNSKLCRLPIFEAPGQTRVGRFGWNDQHSGLLSFIGDGYLNEMGVTNRLRPTDVTSVLKTTKDPEDVPDDLGLADIDHFAQFIRGTMVSPPDIALAATPAAIRGGELFRRFGCGLCHVESITTAPAGTVIDGGMFISPVTSRSRQMR